MIENDKWISIGEIVAPQGLRGNIRLNLAATFLKGLPTQENDGFKKITNYPLKSN